jgi:CRISPR-associated protein Cst2
MTKNAIGFVLIDAPHSALNNAGADVGSRTENTIAVKKVRRGRDEFPYVSAQAWRKWWRDALEDRCGWKMSPVIRESKIAFTSANPFLYPDDDVFGYMRAQKGDTLTRLSPLKTSPLLSEMPHIATDDFGVMARFEHMSPDSKEKDNNPVPHEHQFYSTILKGIFALDLSAIGVFQASARTGYRNLTEKYIAESKMVEAIGQSKAAKIGANYVLPSTVRAQRAKDALLALPFLSGGAKQALHHTDITPKLIILCTVEGGNNLWMNIATQDDKKPVSIIAIKQIVEDYTDIIRGDVFIGRQEGFADDLAPDLQILKEELSGVKTVYLSSPRKAVEAFAQTLDMHFEG